MQFQPILTSLTLVGSLWLAAILPAQAQSKAPPRTPKDQVLLDMGQAFEQQNSQRLRTLLPLAKGHLLEPWAAYWELRVRLGQASPAEIEAFLQRYAGTYQEDRLRNDWLLLLGQAADWDTFKAQYPLFRMNDDRSVQCFAWLALGQPWTSENLALFNQHWLGLREADLGCAALAQRLLKQGKLAPDTLWLRARLGMVWDNLPIGKQAVEILDPKLSASVNSIYAQPQKFLKQTAKLKPQYRAELTTLALVRLARRDLEGAIQAFSQPQRQKQLSLAQRSWVWGVIGQRAAMQLSDQALGYFRNAKNPYLHEDQLAWRVRAALRAGRWDEVDSTIAAMHPSQRQENTWVYWRARALLQQAPNDAQRALARGMLQGVAGHSGFYEQLAQEELGRRISAPETPQPPSAAEKAAAQANLGLQRALHAIKLGLRNEGVREWNYHTNLHTKGGMNDRELLAAADLACQHAVWDRCINTSERTKSFADYAQRFPMPYKNLLIEAAKNSNLEAAYVYGLIRQESRFVADATSSAGASGLMQVMPATARWTAKKIGLTSFKLAQLQDPAVNLTIGMAYLKLLLDDFSGAMPLATAAYNAGPSRAKSWRGAANAPTLEAAVWIENLPFSETRNYVKKVLSNSVTYDVLLSGTPQSLQARLGQVRPATQKELARLDDLP
jgi:soluble lytic murein transglycosylase